MCAHHHEEVSFREVKLAMMACRTAQVCNLCKARLKSHGWILGNVIVNSQAGDDTVTIPPESPAQPEKNPQTTHISKQQVCLLV